MNLELFQKLFQKSWQGLNQKKYLLVFFSLCFLGLLVVFSRVIAIHAGMWINLSLSFAPIFLIGGLLFALGILLIKCYLKEQKGEEISYVKIALNSWKSVGAISYITLPMLLLCLISWLVLGVFFLLKEVPKVGDFMGVILSFAPFILILAALFLIFLNIALLFFLTPEIAKSEVLSTQIWKNVYQRVTADPLGSLLGFFLAIFPLGFMLVFLVLAAILTQKSCLIIHNPILVGLKWFFLMLPFNALLTPAVIFFFNFSQECYRNGLHKALQKA